MEVVVAPAAGTDLGQYMFWSARVRVAIESTDGEVLVVPVAALTVGPDEASQVEVERTPATDEAPAETEVVDVTVGLSANGLAEVEPLSGGALTEGDRVVYRLDGHDAAGLPDRERAGLRAKRLGFVFHAFHLLEHRSALENVMFGGMYQGMPNVNVAIERSRPSTESACSTARRFAPTTSPVTAAATAAAAGRGRCRGTSRTASTASTAWSPRAR